MARPSKHAENSAATRARLLELGIERFPLKGYSATSIRDLLDGSGLAIGAFYYHFTSKTDFFLAILDHVSGPRGAFGALAASAAPETLEDALLLVLGPLAADPRRGAMSLVVADFALVHRDDPDIRGRVVEVRRHAVREIADFLAVMQERGLVRDDMDVELLASMVFATVEGHVFHQEIYGEGFVTALDAAVRVLGA